MVGGLLRRQLLAALGGTMSATALVSPVWPAEATQSPEIVRFPDRFDKKCRAGNAKLYDECGSQLGVFTSAMQTAKVTGKTLLISYGAEWCIWCHVFDAYIDGQYSNFEYHFDGQYAILKEYHDERMVSDAKALHAFVSKNFVIAHIEAKYSPDGPDVLVKTGARRRFDGGYPFIYSVMLRGRWAASFDHDQAELRREGEDWFRGYDRRNLLAQLKAMRAAASV
jgi:hypothetical protein